MSAEQIREAIILVIGCGYETHLYDPCFMHIDNVDTVLLGYVLWSTLWTIYHEKSSQ